MTKGQWYSIAVILMVGSVGAFAQRFYSGTANRGSVPDWTLEDAFKDDAFTFVRIEYDSYGRGGGYRGRSGGRRFGFNGQMDGGSGFRGRGFGRGGGFRGGGGCYTDWPDSDLNFSYRLHQLTSMQVDPHGKVIRLTDPELFHYPFIYIVEPGSLVFREEEVKALRQYLLNGGFLMVDDFWGEAEWYNFYREIKRVFPDREPVELDISHPIFHMVFDLKEKPQIPGIMAWFSSGVTYERDDAREVHYKALYDDQGRIMAIICHNTDLGDGWEEEATNPDYFHMFSEKYAYPLGINIVFYAMTH